MANRRNAKRDSMHSIPPAAAQESFVESPVRDDGTSVQEWARLQERLLAAQLAVIRKFLAERNGDRATRDRRKSQINLIREILAAEEQPLHISEIIQRAAEQYAVALDRESVVSAMAKKVRKGILCERVGPNTFSLKK